VLEWFQSYLYGPSQYVRCGIHKSPQTWLTCGVPQGSVLGPILFIMYTADLVGLIERHGFHPHLYADDTQVYDVSPMILHSYFTKTFGKRHSSLDHCVVRNNRAFLTGV